MRARTLTLAAGAALALAGAAPAASPASVAAVCNEAENSPRGGWTVNGPLVDPKPPAFLRGSQMRVGNDTSAGLVHAAERSPVLRTCGPAEPSGGGTTDSGTTDSGTTDSGTTDSGTTDSGTTDSGGTDGAGGGFEAV